MGDTLLLGLLLPLFEHFLTTLLEYFYGFRRNQISIFGHITLAGHRIQVFEEDEHVDRDGYHQNERRYHYELNYREKPSDLL